MMESASLLSWYETKRRPLPWRIEISPYNTWVSEVMSQQTTLTVVVPRYLNFLKHFSSLESLYNGLIKDQKEDLMRSLWQGLGYYARARNLVKGVCYVVEECGGIFPESYEQWLKVPGVGPYTASVLASVHNGEAVACLDGNVTRVVARMFGLSNPEEVWGAQAQIAIRQRAQNWMNTTAARSRPGDFNQAMMELGATVCTKHQPQCNTCPWRQKCVSFRDDLQAKCPPVKPKKEKELTTVTAWLFEKTATPTEDKSYLVTLRNTGFLKSTKGFPLTKGSTTLPQQAWPMISKHSITNHKIELRAARFRVSDLEKIGNLQAEGSALFEAQNVWKSLNPAPEDFVTLDELSQALSSSLDVKVLKWLKKVPGLGS